MFIWNDRKKKIYNGRKSGLVISKLDSQLEGRGFESHPILDGNGVKAMLGSIPTPNPGSFSNWKRKKIQGAKWGTPKKKKYIYMEDWTN